MKFTREFYIPQGAVKVSSKKSDAVVYLGENYNIAVGFVGKAQKPSFNYRFRLESSRASWVADWLQKQDAAAAYRAEKKAERKAEAAKPHNLKPGDILSSSWGYDQTNIDYYQVVGLIGSSMVYIREIGCESVQDGFMQGESVPCSGKFIGERMRKKVAAGGDSVKVRDWGVWARKMNPVIVAGMPIYRSQRWTAYA